PVEPLLELPIERPQRRAAVTLLERLSDADDRRQLRRDGGRQLAVHGLVGLSEQASALGVPDDHVLRARFLDHPGADFAGEGPLPIPMKILGRDADGGPVRRVGRRAHRGERRRDDDLDVVHRIRQLAELLDERDRLLDGLVHLPVRGEEGCSHLSGNAATPGSSRPPRNSSDAPPPVEMCVILPLTPAFATAAIESPPPTTVVPCTDATAFATSTVPFANASISKTPIGPFQTTVFAPSTIDRYFAIVFGPMSRPMRSPIFASPTSSVSAGAPASGF